MNLTRKARIILLLTAVLYGVAIKAVERTIYVLSDTHVMAPSLLDSPTNKQWINDLSNSKTMLDISASTFDIIVQNILTNRPDLVLISGDLTKDGEVESHQYVIDKLDKIRNAGIGVYVIPGNHDRGYMDMALKYANDTSTVAETLDNYTFPEYYVNYGYGNNTERCGTTLSYVAEPLPGLTLIGIDTGIWCWYREGTVDWVCEKSIEARKKGNQVLVMQHHPLMPHYYTQHEIFELCVPDDYEEVRERFANSGIRVVLTGHTHASDIARYTSSEGHDIYDINSGCTISYPCDYRILTLNGNSLKVSTNALIDYYDTLDKNFSARAEMRLLNFTTEWALKWLGSRGIINEFFASELAFCFVLHALGDEPENPGSANQIAFFKIVERLAPEEGFSEDAIEKLRQLEKVISSMLGDYQDPEEPNNVVKDRELTIDMSFSSPVGIQEVEQEETDEDSWYTLQGVRLQEKPSHRGIYIHNGKTTIIR